MRQVIKFKIKRFDPMGAEGNAPYWQAYNVKLDHGMTVLEALLKIEKNDDPTLSFRRSCRSAICGSCALMINGTSKLACHTQIAAEFEKHGEMVIGPLDNYQVLKDLIVDFTPFWLNMERVKPYLVPKKEPKGGWVITNEDTKAIDASQKCIMCGSCNGACNSQEIDANYIGPSASAKAWRFVGDIREGDKRLRLDRISQEHGIWDCVRCVSCTEVCPKDVAPLTAIEKLREEALAEGLDDNPGAKHALALVDSVKRVGRLDEATMTFKTLGFLRSLGMIPFGLKMQMHGKMPHPILFPAIGKLDEVRGIYKARERQRKNERKKKG